MPIGVYVRRIKPLAERFWAKVQRSDGCWEWKGSCNPCGYGTIWLGVGQRKTGAHRASWELHNGAIENGLHVLHKCDNPPCVNPAHLFLGTIQDNSDDREAKGRTWARNRRKFTADNIATIRRLHGSGGLGYRKLALLFGADRSTIRQVLVGETYRRVAS